MESEQSLRMSAAAAQQLAKLRDVGYCVLPQVIPANRVPAVRDSVLSAAISNAPSAEALKKGVVHLPALLNYDQSLAPYLAVRDPLLDVVEEYLGPGARISFVTSQTNLAGCDRGEWHADYPYNQSNFQRIPAPYAPGPHACFGVTCIFMLSDFTKDSGGTLVVPRSFLKPCNPTMAIGIPQFDPHPNETQVTGEAGSVFVMDSRTWHAVPARQESGPDTAPRVAVAVRYSPWYAVVYKLQQKATPCWI